MPRSDSDISLEPFFNNSVSDEDGTKRNLRIVDAKNAVAGYQLSDQYVSLPTSYYGYLDKDENWYIIKTVTTDEVTTYRFKSGTSGYAAAWTGRAALSYDYFSEVF